MWKLNSNPQKAHPWRKTRLLSAEWWRPSASATCRRAEENKKKRKEGRKEDTRNSGKLAIRPDHPRRGIKIKLCMVGGLRCVVIHVKCDPNRLRGYGTVGSKMALSYYFGQWLIQQLVLPYKPWYLYGVCVIVNAITRDNVWFGLTFCLSSCRDYKQRNFLSSVVIQKLSKFVTKCRGVTFVQKSGGVLPPTRYQTLIAT